MIHIEYFGKRAIDYFSEEIFDDSEEKMNLYRITVEADGSRSQSLVGQCSTLEYQRLMRLKTEIKYFDREKRTHLTKLSTILKRLKF